MEGTKQDNLVRKMLYSNMKLHVSASNDHQQVSTPIKKILGYISVWGSVAVEISLQ